MCAGDFEKQLSCNYMGDAVFDTQLANYVNAYPKHVSSPMSIHSPKASRKHCDSYAEMIQKELKSLKRNRVKFANVKDISFIIVEEYSSSTYDVIYRVYIKRKKGIFKCRRSIIRNIDSLSDVETALLKYKTEIFEIIKEGKVATACLKLQEKNNIEEFNSFYTETIDMIEQLVKEKI